MAVARGFEETVSSGGKTKTDGTGASPAPGSGGETANGQPSLGQTMAAARDRRGLSRAEVAAQTHIPANYIAMIESSDYGLIADQLYLMPFLRRYAAFLGMDGEDVAMRFVHEVQRAEGAAPVRLAEPIELKEGKGIRWGRLIAALLVLAAIVALYVIASRDHRRHLAIRLVPPSSSLAPVSHSRGAIAIAPTTVAGSEASGKAPETTVVAGPNQSEAGADARADTSAPSAVSASAINSKQDRTGHR